MCLCPTSFVLSHSSPHNITPLSCAQDGMVCLVKAGRTVELAGLLRLQSDALARGGVLVTHKPLDAPGLVAALAATPQSLGIKAQDGADLVDAAAPLVALPTAYLGEGAEVRV